MSPHHDLRPGLVHDEPPHLCVAADRLVEVDGEQVSGRIGHRRAHVDPGAVLLEHGSTRLPASTRMELLVTEACPARMVSFPERLNWATPCALRASASELTAWVWVAMPCWPRAQAPIPSAVLSPSVAAAPTPATSGPAFERPATPYPLKLFSPYTPLAVALPDWPKTPFDELLVPPHSSARRAGAPHPGARLAVTADAHRFEAGGAGAENPDVGGGVAAYRHRAVRARADPRHRGAGE